MSEREDIPGVRKAFRDHIPDMHKGAFRKVWDKAMLGASLRACVKAKCLDCSNWQKDEIKDCQCPACALYEVRPYVKRPKRIRRASNRANSPAKPLKNSAPEE